MVARDVVEALRRYVLAVEAGGIPVSFAVVYGSQARGDARPDSDIDVMVVSPHFDGNRAWGEASRLWLATRDQDWRIEPVPCGLREWQEDDSRVIVEIARREGTVLDRAALAAA